MRVFAAGMLSVVLLAAVTSHHVRAQGTLQDYRQAEQFLYWNADDLVTNLDVRPHWTGEGAQFWYREETEGGKRFVLFRPEENRRQPAFDHQRLADALSEITGERQPPEDLPFETFAFAGEDSIRFSLEDERWTCSLASYDCTPTRHEDPVPGRSPDGEWVAFVKAYDLYLRAADSGAEYPLTRDGAAHYRYATPLPSPAAMVEEGTMDVDQSVDINWSPDAEKFVAYRIDQRGAGRLSVIDSSPEDQWHPQTYTYVYPLAGDSTVPTSDIYIFDVETRERVKVDTEPVPSLYYGGGPLLNWFAGGERLYFVRHDRGYQRTRLIEVDAETGATRTLIEETTSAGNVDPHMTGARMIDEGAEILWRSERDGWAHLYLYDGATGALKHQVTQGAWVVRSIEHVDEEERQVYFLAGGREAGRDPYLRHLYRINLDGSGLTLLTPEPADHDVSFSPDGTYFVDTYSRVDEPPVTVLRRSADGAVVERLAEADVGKLLATGWTPPEPFVAKAQDGETDLYGVLWRPTDFDSTRTYPVVEQIYTGPHSFHVPKTFGAYRSTAQAIAELGFVVVMVDGRGTGRRSRAFRHFSYKNLGGVIGDHVAVLRQLAERYPYLDLSRVGIYGHSAGGYDAAHALLTAPDVYKVAVASSGNHDHRMDKAWWNELWMGYPAGAHYGEQSNLAVADQLEGELLLVHGALDENVNPAATMKLVDALIEANEDFDLLLIPGEDHGLGDNTYFIRRRWDYFVEHLLGVAPPEAYVLEEPDRS